MVTAIEACEDVSEMMEAKGDYKEAQVFRDAAQSCRKLKEIENS